MNNTKQQKPTKISGGPRPSGLKEYSVLHVVEVAS